MLRFTILAILFVAVCAAPFNATSESADVDVIVVKSIEDYLAQNPNVKILEEFEKDDIQDRQRIRYTVGQRNNGVNRFDWMRLFQL